jgi:tetratricopeptide (TPR) repeat protein
VGDPEDPLVLADALARERRHGEALDILSRLAAARPEDWRVAVRAAYSLTALGRYAQALVQADRAVELAPSTAEAHAQRGYCLVRLRRSAAGEDAAREALRLDPHNIDALHVAALASSAGDRPERALAYGWHAVDLAPSATVALRAYGVGLGASRRWAEAEEVWRSVLLREPGDRQAMAGLVDALSGQGRRQDARLLAEGLHADAGPEVVARTYRGDATWLAVAGALVVLGVLPAFWGSVATAGTVLLALLAVGYGVLRRGWTRSVPATAEGRAAVARLDRSRDRAVAAFGGVLAVVSGVGWLAGPGGSLTSVVAGTLLLIGGIVAFGVAVNRVGHRP